MRRRFAQHGRFVAGGDDDADIRREDVAWKVSVHGEEQGIGKVSVVGPFVVAHKIDEAGFHLNADKTAVWAEGEDVGAPAVRQGYFVQGRPSELAAESGGSAAHECGALGKREVGQAFSFGPNMVRVTA